MRFSFPVTRKNGIRDMKSVLRITLDGKNVHFQSLNDERFSHYGFGTFLEEYDPKEVEITKEAREAILKQPYRHGLQGAEFFCNPVIIAWGSLDMDFLVPLKDICIHDGADEHIRKLKKRT